LEPTTIPWWVPAILTPLGIWFGAQAWPAIVKAWERRDTSESAEEAEERAWKRQLDERHVKAQEITAQALEGIRGTLSVMQFQISDIREHVGMTRQPRIVAKAGRTEGERGE
jgi:hypothetical protein